MLYDFQGARYYGEKPMRSNERLRGWGAGVDRQNNGYQQKKHSGCRLIKTEKGEFLSGWKYSRQSGMLKITANFWKKCSSDKYEWEAWVVSVMSVSTGQKSTYCGLYNPKNGKLRINSLNWVLNPNASNGGYIGKSFSKEFKAGRR